MNNEQIYPSPKEEEILQLLTEGYTNREMAELLHKSIRTVESQRQVLREKFHLRTRKDLVEFGKNYFNTVYWATSFMFVFNYHLPGSISIAFNQKEYLE